MNQQATSSANFAISSGANFTKNSIRITEVLNHPIFKDDYELLNTNSTLRFDEGNLLLEDRQINGGALEHLCRQTKTPLRYPLDVTSQMINHDLESLRNERKAIVLKNGTFHTFCNPRLVSLSPLETIETLLDAIPANDLSQTRVAKLSCEDGRFDFDFVCENKTVEPRVGDVIKAGLTVSSYPFSDKATHVEGFFYRLVCQNGMIQKECVANGGHRRTRRLPIGNDIDKAKIAQREQLSRLVTDSWEGLRNKLSAIIELTVESVNVQHLIEQALRRSRLYSRRLLQRTLDAWEVEGGDGTAYGVMNALTRVATHDTEISLRQSHGLSRVAGILAGESIHICPRCWSLTHGSQ